VPKLVSVPVSVVSIRTSFGGHRSGDGVRVEEKADGVGGEDDVKEVSLLQLSELAPSV
jgi:hypothetical protein